jgi:hypothetical protein
VKTGAAPAPVLFGQDYEGSRFMSVILELPLRVLMAA